MTTYYPDHASAADAYERDASDNIAAIAGQHPSPAIQAGAAAAQAQALLAISHRLAQLCVLLGETNSRR